MNWTRDALDRDSGLGLTFSACESQSSCLCDGRVSARHASKNQRDFADDFGLDPNETSPAIERQPFVALPVLSKRPRLT